MTNNYERIMSMGVKELSVFLQEKIIFPCFLCEADNNNVPCDFQCIAYCEKWLKSEVSNNE